MMLSSIRFDLKYTPNGSNKDTKPKDKILCPAYICIEKTVFDHLLRFPDPDAG